MNTKSIVFTIVCAVILFTGTTHAQSNQGEQDRHEKDSIATVELRDGQLQDAKDEQRMAEAKLDRKQTKAKAKNARRIENDANSAARESRYAVRAERRAQKSRKQANKQADRASKARDKSDSNQDK